MVVGGGFLKAKELLKGDHFQLIHPLNGSDFPL